MKLTKTHALLGVAAAAGVWYFYLRSPSATATCTGASSAGAASADSSGQYWMPVKFAFSDGTSVTIRLKTDPVTAQNPAAAIAMVAATAQGHVLSQIQSAAAAA